MNNQQNQNQNQNELNKKNVQVNPSRDADYGDKDKDFSVESGEQIDEEANEEVNPSKLDTKEVDLDRGGVEFSGGGKKADERGMSSDLGRDISSKTGKNTPAPDMH